MRQTRDPRLFRSKHVPCPEGEGAVVAKAAAGIGGDSHGRWRIRPGVLCRDVCAPAAYQEAARLPNARPDTEGRIHHDKRRRDVCATRRGSVGPFCRTRVGGSPECGEGAAGGSADLLFKCAAFLVCAFLASRVSGPHGRGKAWGAHPPSRQKPQTLANRSALAATLATVRFWRWTGYPEHGA
jgi:hypothetical protein